MPEVSRAGDLRLSIPADAVYVSMASELATRFAEYAGASHGAANDFGKAVERIASPMGGEITLLLEPRERTLVARVTSGTASAETSCTLPG
jgi:hypothetical protein